MVLTILNTQILGFDTSKLAPGWISRGFTGQGAPFGGKGIRKIAPGRISRVFINLIKNSIESIEQKVEKNPDFKKKISIDISSNNDHILISIEDNGVGFDKNNIKEILNPYYTTKKNGTGLGLSIVNKIINDHKGELEFIPINNGAKIQIRFYFNDNRNINS